MFLNTFPIDWSVQEMDTAIDVWRQKTTTREVDFEWCFIVLSVQVQFVYVNENKAYNVTWFVGKVWWSASLLNNKEWVVELKK